LPYVRNTSTTHGIGETLNSEGFLTREGERGSNVIHRALPSISTTAVVVVVVVVGNLKKGALVKKSGGRHYEH
jgi:hypothetical protein